VGENEFTGTGFPCVFYLKYHLYRNYFPLYALGAIPQYDTEDGQFCALRVRPQEFDRQLSTRRLDEIPVEDDRKSCEIRREPAPARRGKVSDGNDAGTLHACNLTCTAAGRIREYKSTINEIMTVEQCVAASDECGAPVVSICGGEPMIYPGSAGWRGNPGAWTAHHPVHNGMFIRKRLHEFKPLPASL